MSETKARRFGPWKILPEEAHRDYIRVRGDMPGGPWKIANVPVHRYAGCPDAVAEEARDIARLIAAAPELLDACLLAKKYLEPDLIEPGRTVFWKLVEALRKAGVTP